MIKIKNLFSLKSEWLDLYCDIWEKDNKELEYWRVEKTNSIIIISIYNNEFILPEPQYRPGVGKLTLDFPGGRGKSKNYRKDALDIVQRELSIEENNIESISMLGNKNFIINSSFNSQTVKYYVAYLNKLHEKTKYIRYNVNDGLLEHDMECLQCVFGLCLYNKIKGDR